MSSHREFYRQNTNPRWDRVSESARSMKNPCAKWARWRTYALTSRDTPLKTFSVETFGAKFLLKINGEPRTVLDSIEMEAGAPPLVLGTQYEMCAAEQQFWMEAVVSGPDERRRWVFLVLINLLVLIFVHLCVLLNRVNLIHNCSSTGIAGR